MRAISKVGQVHPGNAARLAEVLTLIKEDITSELAARHSAAVSALPAEDAAALARFIDAEARALVELYLGAPP